MQANAGFEIGMAGTKAFTSQLIALYILAIHLSRARGVLDLIHRSSMASGLSFICDARH